ncbi:NAD-dependent epimerase/dehydratase family protein [Amycolatopsis eburnea]|uniref:NAD-dependent epimerase/dehydratase family protein n=1 Tax=Amycolatopsis eburnea TaxID=2267691 RepID=A0A427T1V9_9PSEU|nr:NAD-dependent epimerase/dehydratase family protein [Amycolatopsis eburnea]RSD11967.1 NAD-dependent epimerase/dehydratase family protein [Amycolatopsis eburnea]
MNDDKRSVVLVTGGTGYLGGHAVARLLADGYRVRTTVRDLGRAGEVRAAVGPGDLEVVAADLGADAGWAEAAAGVGYVLHVASPFPPGSPETDDEVIRPARDGAVRVLAAAREAGVRRVVLTSSFAAVGYGATPREEYTEADWTDPADPNSAYIRSKVVAERAAWAQVRSAGGPELAVINPAGIFGPVLGGRLSSSVALVRAMLDGAMPVVPPLYFGVVDVRDVADLHVRAMTHPRAAGERFLAAAGKSISFLGMARILAETVGGDGLPTRELTAEQVRAAAETDPAMREALGRLGRVPVIRTDKARSVLGWRTRPVAETIADTARSLPAARLG